MPIAACFGAENPLFSQGKNLLPDVGIFRKISKIRKHPVFDKSPFCQEKVEEEEKNSFIEKVQQITTKKMQMPAIDFPLGETNTKKKRGAKKWGCVNTEGY